MFISNRASHRYSATNLPVVVVKRRRRDSPQVSHNNAWKVAYADFVTAMMSFFLLLWLLSVTTSTQREAISDYFDPAAVSPAKSGAGGVLGGKSVVSPGQQISPDVATGVHVPFPGTPDTVSRHDDRSDSVDAPKPPAIVQPQGRNGNVDSDQAQAAAAEHETLRFKEAEAALRQAIQSVPELQPLSRNLIVDETPEGLRIQMVDQDGTSMFPLGSIDMLDHTRKLLALVQQSVAGLPNKISIRGHTDATPYRNGGDHFNNWDLSSGRANAARRALEAAGLAGNRIVEVIGKADNDPLIPDKPLSAENRRISIILLREAPVPAAAAAKTPKASGP